MKHIIKCCWLSIIMLIVCNNPSYARWAIQRIADGDANIFSDNPKRVVCTGTVNTCFVVWKWVSDPSDPPGGPDPSSLGNVAVFIPNSGSGIGYCDVTLNTYVDEGNNIVHQIVTNNYTTTVYSEEALQQCNAPSE